jgi:hypothetical protein
MKASENSAVCWPMPSKNTLDRGGQEAHENALGNLLRIRQRRAADDASFLLRDGPLRNLQNRVPFGAAQRR